MGTEIERKFLVCNDTWRSGAKGKSYSQGYIAADGCSVRVRIAGDKAYLTLKTSQSMLTRLEFEYAIPLQDAHVLLERFCQKPIIAKTRYCFEYKGFIWEIDEFWDENEGLVVAEIELEDEDQYFDKPEWLGQEVSHDERYLNANLIKNPYKTWSHV